MCRPVMITGIMDVDRKGINTTVSVQNLSWSVIKMLLEEALSEVVTRVVFSL